jgi:hypothetical protein
MAKRVKRGKTGRFQKGTAKPRKKGRRGRRRR